MVDVVWLDSYYTIKWLECDLSIKFLALIVFTVAHDFVISSMTNAPPSTIKRKKKQKQKQKQKQKNKNKNKNKKQNKKQKTKLHSPM